MNAMRIPPAAPGAARTGGKRPRGAPAARAVAEGAAAAGGAGLLSREALAALVAALRAHPSIRGKLDIAESCAALGLGPVAPGLPGDDCAVLPTSEGFDLFAAEGFINAFVAADPWFAGWCGVMVNVSDVLAMGGRPVAVTDAVWAPDAASAAPLLAGLRAAAAAYGVPVVGGHTNLRSAGLQLAVSILGRARALVASFDARPGDLLIAAVDHRGGYRAPFDNWCAALDRSPAELRAQMAILPELAEAGLLRAGKDISQGGIAGTAVMLAECSGIGFEIEPAAIPLPEGVPLDRWLRSFPSFGFLLSVAPEAANAVCARFAAEGVEAAAIGRAVPGHCVAFTAACGSAVPFWDYRETPYLGLAPPETADA